VEASPRGKVDHIDAVVAKLGHEQPASVEIHGQMIDSPADMTEYNRPLQHQRLPGIGGTGRQGQKSASHGQRDGGQRGRPVSGHIGCLAISTERQIG
jgi:hypothetical protein